MIRIVVVDEWEMVRTGMLLRLGSVPDLRIVAGVAGCAEARQLSPSLDPHVAIIDADRDETDVFTVVELLRDVWPEVRVVIVLHALRDAILSRAALNGVDAIVTTRDSIATLQAAIQAVARGRRFHSRSVWCRLVELSSLGTSPQRTMVSSLTRREYQVLFHLAAGRTIRDAASVMGLSPRTVENHKTRLMKRLDIHSGIGLVRYAVREGMIVP